MLRVAMRNINLMKAALMVAIVPLFAGCVTRVVYTNPPPPPPNAAVADTAPPPAQVEVIPPAPGPVDVWFWAPGEWVWNGQWIWVGGHWRARPYAGAVWVHGGWGWRGHYRVWVNSHWR